MVDTLMRTHGGFGNQLYQVFYALLIKNRHGGKLILWHDDVYYHKFTLAECFNFLTCREVMPIIFRTRLIKVLNRIWPFGKIQSLSMGGKIYLDGYFQDIEIYRRFDRLEKGSVIDLLRKKIDISESCKEVSLLHLRLGDFFQDDLHKVSELDEMLRRAGELGRFHCVTNEEKLVEERLKLLHIDCTLVQTAELSAEQLLRLMSTYKGIVSNGSTLATWAAILGGSKLTSTKDQEEFVQRVNE